MQDLGWIRDLEGCPGIRVEPEGNLARYSTFQLGGTCPWLIHCTRVDALVQVVQALARQERAFVLLGGGSNLLVSDEGVDTVVVRFAETDEPIEVRGTDLTVSAAESLDSLAAYTADHGLDGLMCCTGIPGTVGGAIVGNAGAWGEQIGDVLQSVTLLGRDGTFRDVGASELDFRYRWSRLKETPDIVLRANLGLRSGDPDKQFQRREEILALRREKHPDLSLDPCIGSIFKNIEPTSSAGRRKAAGWFLEQAGMKGARVGGAEVFERHANIIVKRPGCTAQQVYDLIRRMQSAVQEKFGFSLEREVRLLGPFEGESGRSSAFY